MGSVEEDVTHMMQKFDHDGDGGISKVEFHRCMQDWVGSRLTHIKKEVLRASALPSEMDAVQDALLAYDPTLTLKIRAN